MPDFQHLLGLREVAPGNVNAAREITTKVAVDKMQHRPVVSAAGEEAFVVQPSVQLKWHDRNLRLRIIPGVDKHVEALIAAGRLLIYHLVAVNIEPVGMILESATETRVNIPLRERDANVVMPRHSLHHDCRSPLPVACA